MAQTAQETLAALAADDGIATSAWQQAQQRLAAQLASYLLLPAGKKILDIGCGDGAITYMLARHMPHLHFIGMDLHQPRIDSAKAAFRLPNLEYRLGSGLHLPEQDALGAVLQRHDYAQLYSFAGYDKKLVLDTLAQQLANLPPGGRMIMLLHIAPEQPQTCWLELPSDSEQANRLRHFAQHARPLHPEGQHGFPLSEKPASKIGHSLFQLDERDAREALARLVMDEEQYQEELLLERVFIKPSEIRLLASQQQSRLCLMAPHASGDSSKLRVIGANGQALDISDHRQILILEKKQADDALWIRPHHVSAEQPSYLTLRGWTDRTDGSFHQTVRRPGDQLGIIPYHVDGTECSLYVKHGYPRPLASFSQVARLMDGRYWSGHMMEMLNLPDNVLRPSRGHVADSLHQACHQLLGLDLPEIVGLQGGALFYPDAMQLDERRTALFAEIEQPADQTSPIPGHSTDFHDNGTLQPLRLQDAINGCVMGAIASPSLEVNLYRLARQLKYNLDDWVGAPVAVAPGYSEFTSSVELLLQDPAHDRFARNDHALPQLIARRVSFIEERHQGGHIKNMGSTQLDYVLPQHGNLQRAVLLPLVQDADDELWLGVAKGFSPVLQQQEGRADFIKTLTADIPASITSLGAAQHYLAAQLKLGAELISPLGSAYWPSIGVSPVIAQPFILASDCSAIAQYFVFVKLSDLFQAQDQLLDGHLLMAVNRVTHALGLWGAWLRNPNFRPHPDWFMRAQNHMRKAGSSWFTPPPQQLR